MGEAALRRLGFEEYVELERASEAKHELIDGSPVAMSGGSLPHGELGVAIAAALRSTARARGCRTYSSDVRVATPSGTVCYPDASVVCGPPETHPADDHTLTNPRVVVEVLSPSTEAYDRGDKFLAYAELASLQHYLLVAQHAPRIEHFARQADGTWRYTAHGPGQHVELLDARIAVDDVYRDIVLEPRPPRA